MNKIFLYLLVLLSFNSVISIDVEKVNDFYSLHARDNRGNVISLTKYRGKLNLVTNVASECGYTETHYEAYVKMQKIFNQNRNVFNILAFPCNQFGKQEPHVRNE
jgi:glutathione peroxidase